MPRSQEDATGPFCPGCGRHEHACATSCADRLALDPPRFCAACGRRLAVQIYPDRVESHCRHCDARPTRWV